MTLTDHRLVNFNSAVGQEFLAFAPAFEATFPFGCELPEATSEETEAPTLEAWCNGVVGSPQLQKELQFTFVWYMFASQTLGWFRSQGSFVALTF